MPPYRNQSIDLLCKSIDWFLYDNGPVMKELKRGSPQKSISLLILSENNSKLSETDFTLFIRLKRYWEKRWQCSRECTVSWISKLQEQRRFKQSWKLCRNLCSLRCLQPKRKRVSNFNPIGSNISYTLLWIGQMKDNSLLWNIARDSEFLIKAFKLIQSFKVEW